MYAIIGAGPMGLSMARNLSKLGLPFVGFESHTDVGGLWDIDSPTSTMYESAHLISSKSTTEFAEFPMPPETASYPHHSDMRRYFRDYARHFGLYQHFEFATEVLRVERDGEGRQLSSRHDGQEQTRHFDAVLICNGTLHHPNIPKLPGEFAGRIMHSAEYKNPQVFEGQRVLMVGCGNSGADITIDAVHYARSVDLSVRRGYYFLPKFLRGRPIDTFGGLIKLPRRMKQAVDAALIRAVVGKPSDYGLPDPDYRLYESHPVMNSLLLHHCGHGDVKVRGDIARCEGNTVHFKDGGTGEYDIILLATGYDLHYPFIDQAELNWQGAAPQLYMNVFHPRHDDLFVMGMVEASGLGWEGRNQQAEMVALYLYQLARGAESARRLQQIKEENVGERLDGGYQYLQLDRMAYYVNKEAYRGAMAKHIAALQADLPATASAEPANQAA